MLKSSLSALPWQWVIVWCQSHLLFITDNHLSPPSPLESVLSWSCLWRSEITLHKSEHVGQIWHEFCFCSNTKHWSEFTKRLWFVITSSDSFQSISGSIFKSKEWSEMFWVIIIFDENVKSYFSFLVIVISSNLHWTSQLITSILTSCWPKTTQQDCKFSRCIVNKMNTVALLLSALNIKTFLCQYLDCKYFKNEDSNLVLCSCQEQNSEVDSENSTENVSVNVFSLFTSG